MSLRDRISTELKAAMRAKDAQRLAVLRMMNAAIKDRDIALRGDGRTKGADEADIMGLLAKLVKQRQESAKAYQEGGRAELAEKELAEIDVIEQFLPQKMSADEIDTAIAQAIEAVGATTLRDMGKVMGHLRAAYLGRMDFGAVGALIKGRLG